jgi:hypothetical protein
MDPPPSYHEILSSLIKVNKCKYELEIQNYDLKKQMEQLKQELHTIKSAYTIVKKNELLLVSILQQSKL